MKHKISILLLVLTQTACSVELRDRDQGLAETVSELRVENEYTLPVPLVQSEQVVLRYDRLYLAPKSKLITQGLNVRFEVKELISDDGAILTFKPDQKAPPGNLGRRGGHVEIIAESASGNLQITLQGEQGGQGLNGSEPDESLRGGKGAKGRNAVYVKNLAGYNLDSPPENGLSGGPGRQGYPGDDGLQGGDSGTALIRVSQTQEFKLWIQKSPGRGGIGGSGGRGGAGGTGGEPGQFIYPSADGPTGPTTAVPGPQGPEGPSGEDGLPGVSGNSEKACVQLASESLHCD